VVLDVYLLSVCESWSNVSAIPITGAPMTKTIPRHLTTIAAGALVLSVVLGCGLTGKLFDKRSMFEGTTAQDAGEAFKKKLGGPIR
jgi:hypothetical protein